MNQIWHISAAEWRYWSRSNLALGGILLFFVLIVATSLLTAMRMQAESHTRDHQQMEAEQTFRDQPDRHPHRMVHYGHYLFRSPPPLALFDPGLDPVTGQSIFLEGHRQNTAMFAESGASADLGGLSQLTPALVYQLFAPLVIILLGFGSIVRERETATLATLLALGLNGSTLIIGKLLALLSFTLVLLLPLILSSAMALVSGASIVATLTLFTLYLGYLTIWVMLTLVVSVVLHKRSAVLAVMTALWLAMTLVLPSLAVNAAGKAPLAGKIETDLAMLSDLRKLGDGHNTNDPSFQQLRANLFKKHGVTRVEDLPINFRGLVAVEAEEKLTQVLNKYANARMAQEAQQEKHLAAHGLLTPTLAIAFASRAVAGTDLDHYHRFLSEAEHIRFEFVQGLNRAHVEKLSYHDDINRNKDEASGLRARVDASNWSVLNTYQFLPKSAPERLANAFSSIKVLLVWLAVITVGLIWSARRIKP